MLTASLQGAVYSISSMTVRAIYTLFARNASYVTAVDPSSVNPALQLPETTAPLNLKNMRSAIQNSLRRIVLAYYQAALGISEFALHLSKSYSVIVLFFPKGGQISQMSMSLTTSAAASTAASSGDTAGAAASSLPIIAAAAGGGVVLIIVIVVVVIVRSKKSSRTSQDPAQRKVVAFENPMYDTSKTQNTEGAYDNAANPSAGLYDNQADHGAGLYDEPAFAAKSDKENPLYESTEHLNEDAPKRIVEGQLYDDPANTDHAEFGFQADAQLDGDAGYLDVAN